MNTADPINLPRQIALWPNSATIPFGSTQDGTLPRLTYYLPSDEYRTGQSMLILPGGGYEMVSTAKEGHRPAQYLAAHGIAAGVLEYRHAPQRHPVPLIDAQRALRLLRLEASKVEDLNPNNIGCMGFSAGGHLAGSLATQDDAPEGHVGDATDALACRPDFFAMIYPVVAFGEAHSHMGSQHNLLGHDAPLNVIQQLSIEKAVTTHTPPCFIAHGQADSAVPIENSIALYQSLTACKVEATMHLYENEGHGFGLARNHPWAQQLLIWLQKR
jgi:acetyl esterase/lipase